MKTQPKTRKPYTLSPEQRQAASERMRAMQAARWAARKQMETLTEPVVVAVPKVRERDPEVQAILDTMTPERKAKLADIQARVLSTAEGQAAIRRAEEQKLNDGQQATPEQRGKIRDVHLRINGNNEVASLDGACVCGKAKREWHTICLRGE